MGLHKNCQYSNQELDCWFFQDSHKNCHCLNLDTFHHNDRSRLGFQSNGSNHLGIHNHHSVAVEGKVLKENVYGSLRKLDLQVCSTQGTFRALFFKGASDTELPKCATCRFILKKSDITLYSLCTYLHSYCCVNLCILSYLQVE